MDLETRRIVRPIRMVIKYVRCLVVQDMHSPHTINPFRYTYVVQTLPTPGMETHPLVDVNYFANVYIKEITFEKSNQYCFFFINFATLLLLHRGKHAKKYIFGFLRSILSTNSLQRCPFCFL